MGYKIARVRGINLTEGDATEALKAFAGAVGMGFLAQQGVIGLYKIGLPFLGGMMTFPLVAGMTVGIGKAMDLYFRLKSEGKSVSKEDLKRAYEAGKKEGRDVKKPVVPTEGDLTREIKTSTSTETKPAADDASRSPERPWGVGSGSRGSIAATDSIAQNSSYAEATSGNGSGSTKTKITSSADKPHLDGFRKRPTPPSAIPPKRIEDLRKQYSVYFHNMEFVPEALTRIVELDKSDRLTAERHIKNLDSGNIDPKHVVKGTKVQEVQVGDDMRMYYMPNAENRKLRILLVGRKSTQKNDLKRVRQMV